VLNLQIDTTPTYEIDLSWITANLHASTPEKIKLQMGYKSVQWQGVTTFNMEILSAMQKQVHPG